MNLLELISSAFLAHELVVLVTDRGKSGFS
jgi:hypothetical protein